MTMTSRARRAFAAALIAPIVLAIAVWMPRPMAGAYTYTPKRICGDIPWREGPRQVRRLIRCAARHYGVNVERALDVARRESNFRPRAYNPSSCAKGVFQHLCRYWPGRAYEYGFWKVGAFNARANIIVTMKMVRRGGWGPWGF
jgi:hypothetical protein